MSDEIERMINDVIEADIPDVLAEPPIIEAPLVAASKGPMAALVANPLFQDEELLGLCHEVLQNIRSDRKQIDSILCNLVEMVFNEGDSTTASKEVLASLMTTKTNTNDKMMKVVSLIAQFKLKEFDAENQKTNKTLNATQENHYHFGGSRRSLLEQIEKMQKKKIKPKTEEKKDE